MLRRKYPDRPRPFRVPGGAVGAWLCTILCTVIMAAVIFIFFCQVPVGTPKGIFYGICGGGTIISMIIRWILYARAKSRESSGVEVAASSPEV